MSTTVSEPASNVVVRPGVDSAPATRITSIDAFRGFVMFLMLAEAMRLWTLHAAFPDSRFWAIVAFNTTHVPWQGCSLHDLIQPAFSFLVGAALPFSIASRRAQGRELRAHARATRSGAASSLILLGIFLRSLESAADLLDVRGHAHADRPRLHLPVPARRSRRCACRSSAFIAILVGFWAAFVAVSAARSGLRLHAGRRAGELAAPLHGLPRALQQELEPVVGVRRVVPEPVPARVAVPLQRAAAGPRSASSRRWRR